MMAPAPGPAAAPQINIVYIQQAGNARMTPSPTDPTSGVLTMNNALDTTLYDQVLCLSHVLHIIQKAETSNRHTGKPQSCTSSHGAFISSAAEKPGSSQ